MSDKRMKSDANFSTTSTVPPSCVFVCLWNMYSCGSIAVASRNIERVQQVFDTKYPLTDLKKEIHRSDVM